jgi:hypothetical protein
MNQFGSMLNSSRVDSTTPFGTTTWTRPDTPDGTWTVNQQLDPGQQQLYDQDMRIRAGQGGIAEGMLGNVADVYNNPVNFAGQLPQFQGINGPQYMGPTSAPKWNTAYDTRDKAEQAYFNRSLRYMYPDWQNRENSLHDRLTAQGFNVSDAAYGDQLATLSNQRDKAMADARDASIQFGGQEATGELNRGIMANQNQADLANNWFRNQLAGAQFGQSEQNRALQWALQNIGVQQQDRARTLNELNAFRTGNQIQTPGMSPQFSTPNLQGIDQLGLATQNYQNQLGAWNAQQASGDNFMSGLMGMAGMALGGPAGSAGAQLMTKMFS